MAKKTSMQSPSLFVPPRTRFLLMVMLASGLSFAAILTHAEEETWQVPVTVGKDGWMIYQNERFGGILPVPPGMVPTRPPDNGDGQRFVSSDGKVILFIYGSFNVEGNGDLEPRWKEALAEPGRTITYKVKKDGWYVISGVMQDGTGFYERYTANSRHGAGWQMTYPQAEEKKYAPWVERVAKGHLPNLGKGYDN